MHVHVLAMCNSCMVFKIISRLLEICKIAVNTTLHWHHIPGKVHAYIEHEIYKTEFK